MPKVRSDRSCSRGFTLIELLIVVAIIGIIAAIAIPNLWGALQRARQKRSMSDIRTVATAVQSYAIDNSYYPRVGDTVVSSLRPHLKNILKIVPALDAWSVPMSYITDDDGSTYTIISFGSNKAADLPYTYGFTQRTRDDIVYNVAFFVQWPEGVQTKD